MEIEVQRDGTWVKVDPKELTTGELCNKLSYIQIETDEFISKAEVDANYAVINEAIRRLALKGDC